MGNIAIIILYHVISIYNGQYTMMISPNCCPARPQGRTAAPSLPRWLHARRRSTWQSCPATPWRWKDIICIYIYMIYIYIHIKYKHTYIIQYICMFIFYVYIYINHIYIYTYYIFPPPWSRRAWLPRATPPGVEPPRKGRCGRAALRLHGGGKI